MRNAAYEIIEGKGATYYGVSTALAKIAEVILYDQKAVLTVSNWVEQVEGIEDVTLSLPQLLGAHGVRAFCPPPLDEKERNALKNSARIIRRGIESAAP